MQHKFVWILAAGLLVSGGAAIRRLGHAPAVKAQGGCAVGSLQGTYGIHITGWFPSSNASTPLVPFAQVGLMTVDGGGNVRLAVTNNSNGQISKDNFAYTVQVNADCTGSLTPAPGIMAGPADFTIVDEGKQLLLVVTQPGILLSGIAVRQ